METKINSNGLSPKMIIFLFMMFAVDFNGLGWYIFAFAFASVVAYIFVSQKKIVITSQFVWIMLLAISNFMIMFFHSSRDIVTITLKYLISPFGGYLLGVVFTQTSFKKGQKSVILLYMCAVIPYFIHGLLNLLIFDGFSDYDFERNVIDFWTGEKWKATLACTYFAMTVPMCFFAFITKGILKKIFYLLLTVVSVYASIVTASRTVIYIGLIVILLEFLLYFKNLSSAGKRTKILLAFVVIITLAMFILIQNLDKLSSTQFFSRMTNSDVEEEPRIQLFKNIIFNCWQYPFGNMPYFYSHNTWLDFLRESGWITFFCFVVITIGAIKNIVLIYKNKSIDIKTRVAVIGMMSALMIDMFVEPMMDGSPILFCLFFYFLGVNDYCVQYYKRRLRNV